MDLTAYTGELKDLAIACRRAYNNRLQMGTGGNVSRVVDGRKAMVIKASGGSFDDRVEEVCTLADLDGMALTPERKPSGESCLHGFLYRKYADIEAVVHVHSPYAIAWSSVKDALPMVTKQAMLKIGYDIPVIDVTKPSVTREDLPMLDAALSPYEAMKVFILKDHGVVAVGPSAEAAEHMAELVEETAMVAVIKEQLKWH